MSDIDGCRGLVAAILDQALTDLMGGASVHKLDRHSAQNFVNPKNKLFCYYCDLLGYDPEYVAEKMTRAVREGKFRPIKKFRK